jgi:hypothetical protein
VLLKACSSIRHIVYLLHKAGITQAEYLRASDTHWKHLEDEHLIDFPMRIVRDRRRDNDEISVRFLESSKERLLRLSRDMLAQRPNSALLVRGESSRRRAAPGICPQHSGNVRGSLRFAIHYGPF